MTSINPMLMELFYVNIRITETISSVIQRSSAVLGHCVILFAATDIVE
jgi:hypothetical protein